MVRNNISKIKDFTWGLVPQDRLALSLIIHTKKVSGFSEAFLFLGFHQILSIF